MAGFGNIEIKQELRLCSVNDRLGYFHCWEHYSLPVEESPLIGGAPAGVISYIRGVVEFPEGVEYVFPRDIKFCDETNDFLREMTEYREEVRRNEK